MIDKVNLWEWRPKDIYYKVNYDLPYKGYLKLEDNNNIKDMKILFAIDGSYSTEFKLYKKKLMTKEEFLSYIENNYLGSTFPEFNSKYY